MYSLDYVDEQLVEEAKKLFRRIYPELKPHVLGVSRDKTSIIIECEFPDGTFYFRVDDNSVSSSYNSMEDADRS